MTRATEPVESDASQGYAETLGYPVATTVALAAREPSGRDGPERVHNGTA